MSSPSHPASDEEPATAKRGEPIRTLLWTAATARPLAEVAILVGLLKRTPRLLGRRSADGEGDQALRAASPARPVGEVRQLVALLSESPHSTGEVDTTLRAAAVGRPVEDAGPAARPAEPAAAPHAAAAQARNEPGRHAGSALRWAAGGLLLLIGLIQLPADSAGLRAGGYTDGVSPALALVCVALAVLLAVHDAVWVWALVAAVAVAALLLHALTAALGTADVLRHSVGSALTGSGAAQAACAALAVLALALAGAGLLRRPRPAAATDEA